MCSSCTIADSWGPRVHSFWHLLTASTANSEYLCFLTFCVYKTVTQRAAALQLPRADSVRVCSDWCWVTGQGQWQRCFCTGWGLGSVSSSSKILWLARRLMQEGLPLCANIGDGIWGQQWQLLSEPIILSRLLYPGGWAVWSAADLVL